MNVYIPKWVLLVASGIAVLFFVPPSIYSLAHGDIQVGVSGLLLAVICACFFVERAMKPAEPRVRLPKARRW